MTNIPVLDGHNDTLLKLRFPERGEERNFFERSDVGHIDLPRAREGGFGGGFFACYVRNPENDGWTEEPRSPRPRALRSRRRAAAGPGLRQE